MPSGTSSSCAISLSRRAVFRAGDLAADAAAARGVGHQHRIAAGERQIGGQRRALGAALFLDHLHQHHLPALDHFLDLVLAAVARRAVGHLFQRVGAADGFDDFFAPLLVAVARRSPSPLSPSSARVASSPLRRRRRRSVAAAGPHGVVDRRWLVPASARSRRSLLLGSTSVSARAGSSVVGGKCSRRGGSSACGFRRALLGDAGVVARRPRQRATSRLAGWLRPASCVCAPGDRLRSPADFGRLAA